MADKPSTPNPKSQKRRPADQPVRTVKENKTELDEETLKNVAGGGWDLGANKKT